MRQPRHLRDMDIDSPPTDGWRLLAVSLPTEMATARLPIWRALRALGCVPLRDGACLLPGGDERERSLRELADECTREGGTAWLMAVQPSSKEDDLAYRRLFDRSDDYGELRKAWEGANRAL